MAPLLIAMVNIEGLWVEVFNLVRFSTDRRGDLPFCMFFQDF